MFDAVPISVALTSEIEAVATASVVQRVRTVDQKHSVVNVVFLSQFTKERYSITFPFVVSSVI
jgi:hypothetical protein